MDWPLLGAFILATMIILVTPGPVMAIIIGNTLSGGQAVGVRTVLGIGLGELVLVGLIGLSVLLSSRLLGQFFPWCSLAGAAYLAWLAARTVLRRNEPVRQASHASCRPFVDGLAVTVSNPTALLFYSAFFMPFVQQAHSLTTQLGVLAAFYILLSLTFDLACVMLVARLSGRRLRSATFAQVAQLGSATVYLGTSALAIGSFLQAVAP